MWVLAPASLATIHHTDFCLTVNEPLVPVLFLALSSYSPLSLPSFLILLQVKASVYLSYLRAGGSLFWAYIVLLFVCQQAASFSRSYWLSLWTNDPVCNGTQQHTQLRVGVFFFLSIAQGILGSGFLMGIHFSSRMYLLLVVLEAVARFFFFLQPVLYKTAWQAKLGCAVRSLTVFLELRLDTGSLIGSETKMVPLQDTKFECSSTLKTNKHKLFESKLSSLDTNSMKYLIKWVFTHESLFPGKIVLVFKVLLDLNLVLLRWLLTCGWGVQWP